MLVAPSAAGTSRGGAGRVSNLKFITATNDSGGAGGLNTTTPITPIVVYHARNNAGAAGGSSPSAAVPAITGGSIEIASNSTPTINSIITHVNLGLVGQTAGITAAYGGRINAGPTLGAGQNGTQMIGSSLKSFGGGIGDAYKQVQGLLGTDKPNEQLQAYEDLIAGKQGQLGMRAGEM